MTTPKTTRRAILAASAAALAAGATVSTNAINTAQSSIPLVKIPLGEYSVPGLARAFEAIYQRWKFQFDLDAADRDAFHDFIFRRTGVRYDFKAEYSKQFDKQVEKLACEWSFHSCDPDLRAWGEIHDELYPLAERIVWQPIRSLADLVLAARITAVINHEWWLNEPEHAGEWMPMALVDQILHMAGVQKFPEIEAPTALSVYADLEATELQAAS